MRRVPFAAPALTLAALIAVAAPGVALAQSMPGSRGQSDRQQQGQGQQERQRQDEWNIRQAPIRGQVNAGPCPYVKILYDAARYVELEGDRPAAANVGYTGEIQGVSADCRYRDDDPITVDMDILFAFGKGPQAASDQRTYRYWVAVTERNSAVLAKEYFDIGVDFAGSDRAGSTEEIRGLTIPRAGQEVSGSNFEILIGFDVTPQMAEFNRTGSRFRINAGQ